MVITIRFSTAIVWQRGMQFGIHANTASELKMFGYVFVRAANDNQMNYFKSIRNLSAKSNPNRVYLLEIFQIEAIAWK